MAIIDGKELWLDILKKEVDRTLQYYAEQNHVLTFSSFHVVIKHLLSGSVSLQKLEAENLLETVAEAAVKLNDKNKLIFIVSIAEKLNLDFVENLDFSQYKIENEEIKKHVKENAKWFAEQFVEREIFDYFVDKFELEEYRPIRRPWGVNIFLLIGLAALIISPFGMIISMKDENHLFWLILLTEISIVSIVIYPIFSLKKLGYDIISFFMLIIYSGAAFGAFIILLFFKALFIDGAYIDIDRVERELGESFPIIIACIVIMLSHRNVYKNRHKFGTKTVKITF